MTSKPEQLLIELYLLRARYTPAEIERVAQIRELQNDPLLRALIVALRGLQETRGPLTNKSSPKKMKGTGFMIRDSGDPQAVIKSFVARLNDKKILRSREQLDSFAQSIGVHGNFSDRRELVREIREKLERLPKAQAAQKITSFGGSGSSSSTDSGPYVELAKTLMRS